MLASLVLLIAAEGTAISAAAAPAAEIAEPNPREMSRSEMNRFNEQVGRDHPYYIRCVKTLEIGSLVKKNLSCRTNEKWQIAERTGNANALELQEHFKPKFMNRY